MEPFRFGLFTDVQYADRPMKIGRYYTNALQKTQKCIDAFNHERVDFCVHLGDLIDWPGDPAKGREALAAVMPVISQFHGDTYFLLGNHDVDSVPIAELASIWELNERQTWRSFDYKGIHFVLMDCNFNSEGTHYQPGTTKWDQCYVPANEITWLQSDLSSAQTEIVIVMIHALLDDMDNPHVIRNAPQVRGVLEKSGKRVVVFQGHMHTGNESAKNGIGYHTLRSIVDGASRTSFWIVEVTEKEIAAYVYDSVRFRKEAQKRILLSY